MYSIKTQSSFDSAHFLRGYEGKCGNIHGHRWRVCAVVAGAELREQGGERGMVADFGRLKADLRAETQKLDHTLLVEKGTLREATLLALQAEGFLPVTLDFPTTAENLAKYFWDALSEKGWTLERVEVHETDENCAVYSL